MPIDPRTVKPISDSDSLAGADDQIMYDVSGWPGDGSGGLVLVDVGSDVQGLDMGLRIGGASFGSGNIPVGAKWYMLYEDGANHVRVEAVRMGDGTEQIQMIVALGGVETVVVVSPDANTVGYISMRANGHLGMLRWDTNTGSSLEVHNLTYDAWSSAGFSGLVDQNALPHGTKMGWDFSGTNAVGYSSWTVTEGAGYVFDGEFWAAALNTSIDGWVPSMYADPISGYTDGSTIPSVSRWRHLGGGVTAQPFSYGVWSNDPIWLLRHTGHIGGGTVRMRAVRHNDYWGLVVRATDVLPSQGESTNRGTSYIVGAGGYSRWSAPGFLPLDTWDDLGFTDGDVLEVTFWDSLTDTFENRGPAAAGIVRNWTGSYVDYLESLFHPARPPGDVVYLPWATNLEVRINGTLVYTAPGDQAEHITNVDLYGDCVGMFFDSPDDFVVPVLVGDHHYVLEPVSDVPIYADYDFRPYTYGPIAVATSEFVGDPDPDTQAQLVRIDAHWSQIAAPYLRSSPIVRYVFNDGQGEAQDGTSPTWEVTLDPSSHPFGPAVLWVISVTVYNEEGLSNTETLNVYVPNDLPPVHPNLNGAPRDDRTHFSPLDATVVG